MLLLSTGTAQRSVVTCKVSIREAQEPEQSQRVLESGGADASNSCAHHVALMSTFV